MTDRPAFPPGAGVAVAVISVSFAAPLFRLAEAPFLVASFWRLALAVVILLPFGIGALRSWRGASWQDVALVVASGVALAAHFALWVASLERTTVAASTALVTLQAVFVAIGGHFLGDRLGVQARIGIAIAVLGGIVIAAADGALAPASGSALWGDALALAAGLGSAAYMLIGRRVRASRGLLAYVLPVYAVAALTLLLGILATGDSPRTGVDGGNALMLVLLAAVPMLGGHTVANWCLKYLPAHTIATWILLEPVGAALIAWPLLGELPSLWVVAGGVLVLVGAWRTMVRRPEPVVEAAGVT